MLDLCSPEDAVDLTCRATLLRGLERWLVSRDLAQAEAAKAQDVTQAQVSDIKIDAALVKLLGFIPPLARLSQRYFRIDTK